MLHQLPWSLLPYPLSALALDTDGVGYDARITGLACVRLAPGRMPETLDLPSLPGGLSQAWPRLGRMLRGSVVVFHGARVMDPILTNQVQALGLELELPTLCTLSLARRVRPNGPTSLPALQRALALPRSAPGLAGDAEATLQVLGALAAEARPGLIRGLLHHPAAAERAA